VVGGEVEVCDPSHCLPTDKRGDWEASTLSWSLSCLFWLSSCLQTGRNVAGQRVCGLCGVCAICTGGLKTHAHTHIYTVEST